MNPQCPNHELEELETPSGSQTIDIKHHKVETRGRCVTYLSLHVTNKVR